jgi:phosphopantothenoylcysteine decarboxylase/phosphopantothenate--cysteine ligase
MDEDMWLHPSTKNNLEKIASIGNFVLPVDSGELASGLFGEGRMAEPDSIVLWLNNFFAKDLPLKGKRALVTAGPTYEQIDPVRFIGNYSSGKMGIAVARELQRRGAEVTLIIGPTAQPLPNVSAIIHIKSASEMLAACISVFDATDITVMSAAVADYTPVNIHSEKIKKSSNDFVVELTKTTDILMHLGEIKRDNQLLIGFALETNDEYEYAKRKLVEKNADMIVLNSLNDVGAGFGHDTNKITIFTRAGKKESFTTKTKEAVANDIVNSIIQL